MKNARIYDFTIPANGSFSLNVEGENVRIMSCTGNVEIVTDSYRIGPINAGQGQGDSPFNRLTINDKSGVANKGAVLISSADFIDNRINGEVSVIEGGKARTLSGMAFSGAMSTSSDAGNYPYCALYNPIGSGIVTVVNDILFSGGIATIFYVSAANGLPTGAQSNAVSKNSGGTAVPKTKKYVGMLPSGSTYANALAVVNVQASQAARYQLTEPILIQPGSVLAIQGADLSLSMQTTFQFWEDPQ